MVKKKVIGKIQISIGLVLLIVCIIGLSLTYINYRQINEDFQRDLEGLTIMENSEEFQNYPEDSQVILKQANVIYLMNITSLTVIILVNFAVLFLLAITVSILFITQGLVNMSEVKK